jgi:hypothetical protein
MKESLANAIEGMLHSPLLPEIVETLQRRVSDEAERRGEFYRQLRDDEKSEFIDGQVIVHSPARAKHLAVRKSLEKLLDTLPSTGSSTLMRKPWNSMCWWTSGSA